jgi:hypothetical protein
VFMVFPVVVLVFPVLVFPVPVFILPVLLPLVFISLTVDTGLGDVKVDVELDIVLVFDLLAFELLAPSPPHPLNKTATAEKRPRPISLLIRFSSFF